MNKKIIIEEVKQAHDLLIKLNQQAEKQRIKYENIYSSFIKQNKPIGFDIDKILSLIATVDGVKN